LNQGRLALTSRQVDILALVCQGKRNKEIAYQLGLAERTVKSHIRELFLIFGVSNRTELVLAYKDLRG